MKQHCFKALLVILCAITMVSCTKKKGENQGLTNDNYKPFDLMPRNKGSWWLYAANDGAVFYRYGTGKDSTVAGLTYSYYYRIDTTSLDRLQTPEYFGKNGDKYISLIDVDGGQKDYITYVILKDTSYVGQSWTNTEDKKIQGWNLNMLIESDIRSITDELTYNGKTYDSVIYVFNTLKAKSVVMPAYVNCGKLEVWFKKGVGIIREKGDINLINLVSKNYEDWILDYHFVP